MHLNLETVHTMSDVYFVKGATRALVLGAVLSLTLAACGDDTPPEITLNGADTISLEFGDTFTDPGASVSDDKDDDVEVTVTGAVDTQALGVYTLSYDAVDAAGNAAETVTRTVEVVDTTAPVITLNGEAELTVDEGQGFTDPGATVTDAADSTVEIVVTGEVDADTAGTYVLAYDATDASGNAAATVERTVEVVFDGDLAIVSSGSDLVLVGLRQDGTLVQRATAPMPGLEYYNANHMVFGLAQNPSNGDIYATSFNDCGTYGDDNVGCWGNARIDRYTYDINGIQHEGMVYLAQSPLRLLPPTYDSGAGELTAALLNQGSDDLAITTLTGTDLPEGTSLSSDCDGVTLASGDTCDVVVSTATNLTADVFFDITTVPGTFYGRMSYDSDRDAHVSYGVDVSWDEEPTAPPCNSDDFSSVDQVGGCALTALAISDDGTRVYVNEDNDDIGLVFEVEADKSLSFLSASATRMRLQGIAVHPSNNSVYNGAAAFSVDDGTTLTQTTAGSGGNATEVITYGGKDLLVTTLSNRTLNVYDLTNPLVPAAITSLSPSFDNARYQHHSADGNLFVVVGLDDMASVSFDGAEFAELASLNVPVDVGACVDCEFRAGTRIVQVTPDGSHAITGAFVNADDEATADALAFRGLVRAYSIEAGTGAIAETAAIEFPGTSRAMLMVEAPE